MQQLSGNVSHQAGAPMEAAWISERGFHLRESYEMEVGGALKDFEGNRGT